MRRPFTTAQGTWSEREVALLRLTDGEHFGVGEASPLPGFSAESFERARADLERLATHLEGQRAPARLEAIEELLAGHDLVASARFAAEVALLDLLARRQGRPLAALLGAEPRAHVPVNATIAQRAVPDCFARAMAAADQGFGCFKIKVGLGDPSHDLERVRAVREAAGDAATIRIDANGAWSRDQALEALRRMRPFDIDLLEQPTPARAPEDLAWLRRHTPTRLAADEGIRSAEDLERLLELEAVDAVVLKPMALGGLLPARALARRAADAGVTTIYTSLLDAAVGRAAVLHLAAATPLARGALRAGHGRSARGGPARGPALPSARLPPRARGPGARDRAHARSVRRPGRALDAGPGERPRHPGAPPAAAARRSTPRHLALVTPQGTRWSYAELYDRAHHLASHLRARGVERGGRVAVMAPNTPAHAALVHAVGLLGAVLVPLHTQLADDEIELLLERARPDLVVLGDQTQAGALEARPTARLDELAGAEIARCVLPERLALHWPAAIVHTSGSSGTPRGVTLTWQNLIFSATGSALHLGHLPGDQWLAALPLCHVGGLSILWRCALMGTTVELHPGFDAGACAEAIAEGRVTQLSVVSRMLWQILEALGGRSPSERLRTVLVGGGPVPDDLLAACQARGIPAAPTYGMTEASSQITTASPPLDPEEVGSAGLAPDMDRGRPARRAGRAPGSGAARSNRRDPGARPHDHARIPRGARRARARPGRVAGHGRPRRVGRPGQPARAGPARRPDRDWRGERLPAPGRTSAARPPWRRRGVRGGRARCAVGRAGSRGPGGRAGRAPHERGAGGVVQTAPGRVRPPAPALLARGAAPNLTPEDPPRPGARARER